MHVISGSTISKAQKCHQVKLIWVTRRTQNIQIAISWNSLQFWHIPISTNKELCIFYYLLFLKNRSPYFNKNFLILDEDRLMWKKRKRGGGDSGYKSIIVLIFHSKQKNRLDQCEENTKANKPTKTTNVQKVLIH